MESDSLRVTRGRQREARQNDHAVLSAAREVFVQNPRAAVSDVALRAGVGQASLYRRYRTKGALLNAVCADGMRSIEDAADVALARLSKEAFAQFIARFVESGAQLILAGTFDPEPDLLELARRVHDRTQQLIDRAVACGLLRDDVQATDLMLLAGQFGSLRYPGRGSGSPTPAEVSTHTPRWAFRRECG